MKYDVRQIYDWPLILRSVVIGVVCLLVFCLGYFVDFSSLFDQLKAAKQQEIELKSQFISLSEKVRQINSDLEKFPALSGALEQSQKKLITSSELSELLSEILKMGAQNELEFNSFSPGTETKDGIHFKVPIKVVAVGTYDQIASFISQVANMDRIVSVGSVVLMKKDPNKFAMEQAAMGNRLTVEMVLDVYEAKGK